MAKRLPNPGVDYEQRHMTRVQELLEEQIDRSVRDDKDNVIETGTLILKSPDGSYYKIEVDNSGLLSTSAVPVDTSGRPITSGNPYA